MFIILVRLYILFTVYSWKLSRTKQLSVVANTSINNTIASIPVLDNKYYEDIDQSDEGCFFLPELSPGSPVEFVGQCDPNITVVQNFDPVRVSITINKNQHFQ